MQIIWSKEGDLVVTNLNYNDTGQYTCAAKNILGSSEASGSLTVRSKKNVFFPTVNNRLNKACYSLIWAF